MIKLEIFVQPKSNKYLEFTQSVNSMTENLLLLCPGMLIIEKEKNFSFISEMNSPAQLNEILNSKELSILSGAIKTLCEKSEITIQDNGYKMKGTDLREIILKLSKKGKTIINSINI